jgi:hypothetical protein
MIAPHFRHATAASHNMHSLLGAVDSAQDVVGVAGSFVLGISATTVFCVGVLLAFLTPTRAELVILTATTAATATTATAAVATPRTRPLQFGNTGSTHAIIAAFGRTEGSVLSANHR